MSTLCSSLHLDITVKVSSVRIADHVLGWDTHFYRRLSVDRFVLNFVVVSILSCSMLLKFLVIYVSYTFQIRNGFSHIRDRLVKDVRPPGLERWSLVLFLMRTLR